MSTRLVNLKHLLPTQRKLLRAMRAKDDLIVWIGSIRGGKGVGAANGIIELAIRNYLQGEGNHQYILGGQTHSSFVRNNELYLTDIAEQAGLSFKYNGGEHCYELGDFARLYLFGGGNQRSYHPVRGLTAHSAWIDEGTLVDPMFTQTVIERCSFDNSKVIITSNAGRPTHWLKKDYIDEEGCTLLQSNFDENVYYSEQRRQRIKGLNPHTSNYKRAVLNQWVGDEGLVISVPMEARVIEEYQPVGDVVVDPGTASVTAATLWTPTKYGWLVADEYYWEGDKLGRRTDEEHLDAILARWTIRQMKVDPAGAAFRAAARKRGLIVSNAPNNFDKSVQVTENALYGGEVKIHQQCYNLLQECDTIAWNKALRRPMPGPDHAWDTLRYGSLWKYPNYTTRLLA